MDGELLAAHGAVHRDLVSGAGHGQQASLAINYIAAHRLDVPGSAAGGKGCLYLGIGLEEYLYAYYLDEQEH